MSLFRKFLYVFGVLSILSASIVTIAFEGLGPGIKAILGSFFILACIFVPAYIYKRLPNGTGTLRGLEHGSKWQFQEHIKRQSDSAQSLYLWINRLRAACLGAMIGGFLAFCSLSSFSIYTGFSGWFIFSVAWPLWWISNGVGTLIVRGGNFPKELLVGKREFVIGRKSTFAGVSRLVIGLLLLSTPINFLYFGYLFATG